MKKHTEVIIRSIIAGVAVLFIWYFLIWPILGPSDPVIQPTLTSSPENPETYSEPDVATEHQTSQQPDPIQDCQLLEESTPIFIITEISTGLNHSVSLKSDGTVWAWGLSRLELLDSNISRRIPTQVPYLYNAIAVSAGSGHTIVLKDDGTVWSWGDNWTGQLGVGTTTTYHILKQVHNLYNITEITTGSLHSAALKNDGTVWAWGSNESGQLGDGTTTERTSPVQVHNLTDVVAIATGWNHTLALRSDGTIWAWGGNGSGQLGDGTTISRNVPVQVTELNGVVAVAVARTSGSSPSHSVAVRSDGTVWTWGNNRSGQIGDGSSGTNRYTPVKVVGLENITDIAAGGEFTVALRNDGTVWAWGRNNRHQIGDGTFVDRHYVPVQVYGLANIIAISASEGHSIALRNDNTIWGWGSNGNSQLGDGSTTTRATPVRAEIKRH